MLNIALIPIDNRPVCYCLPEQICEISNDIKLLLPNRELTGGLKTSAQAEKILDWLENLETADLLILSLDTIAYGGLVASRRTNETSEQIKKRLFRLKEIILKKNIKTYACSSIMRISANNENEEEKIYWNKYGKKIFDMSYNMHKSKKLHCGNSNDKFVCIKNTIPEEILKDYFETRNRNFEINKMYLEWQKEGIFSYLVFSKDDCAEYGLNVEEAEEINKIIRENNLNAVIKTGADEIPLSLLSRACTDITNKKPKIYPKFLNPDETKLISKYEDISIYESVKGQIEMCGGILANTEDNSDIVLIVNNFKKEQGELVMDIDTEMFNGKLYLPEKPYIIADTVFANGADNNFINVLFEQNFNFDNFLGYAGWNTTANTLGSAICAGMIKFLFQKINTENFKKLQFIRFADDWAYQANCRKKLKNLCKIPQTDTIAKLMQPYVQAIDQKLEMPCLEPAYSFPWNRFFEIEISI